MTDIINEIMDDIMMKTVRVSIGITQLQSMVRGNQLRKRVPLILSSKYQTKNWRKRQCWYTTGKKNECELYQFNVIHKITGIQLEKTHERINISTHEIDTNSNPMRRMDGFEWTEDFDGKIVLDNVMYYFNLKFVCDKGGSQTRSLREVYHFINYQIQHTKKYNSNIQFINILDGDEAFRQRKKFQYLLAQSNHHEKNVFVGDMQQFKSYWTSITSSKCPTIL